MAGKFVTVNPRFEYTEWVEKELIPLLMNAYGKPATYWRKAAQNAEQSIAILPIYEDFESTVERIRLLLIKKELLTRAEIEDFGWIRSKWSCCVGIFVRHALNHGVYPLASLGKEINRDHVRHAVKKPEDEDIYIYAGRLAVNDDIRPESASKWKKNRKRIRKPYWLQDDEQSEPEGEEPLQPHCPQDYKSSDPVDQQPLSQMLSNVKSTRDQPNVELTPLLKRTGLVEVGRGLVGELCDQHIVHQLPSRPKFANHCRTGPLRFNGYDGPHAYPQRGVRPMLEHRSMSPYILSNHNGFPPPSSQHGTFGQPYRYNGMSSHVASQYGFQTSSYQHGAFGEPYRNNSPLAPVLPQVDGSFDTHYRYSSPVLSSHPLLHERAYMPLGANAAIFRPGASEHDLRIEVDKFKLGGQGHGF